MERCLANSKYDPGTIREGVKHIYVTFCAMDNIEQKFPSNWSERNEKGFI